MVSKTAMYVNRVADSLEKRRMTILKQMNALAVKSDARSQQLRKDLMDEIREINSKLQRRAQ